VEIDSVTEDLYKFLSQELYEGLVGLQVFATDLNDTAVQDMMKNHIVVALDTLEMKKILINLKYSKKQLKNCCNY
jgi:hypothetical protein